MSNISIIGLGKLGSCMAAVYASKGHGVCGVDIHPATVAAINSGRAPVAESGLQELITAQVHSLTATHSYDQAVGSSDITFIIVPTPTDETGGFNTDYARQACASVGAALAKKTQYHVVVMTSTVLPGDCNALLIPELEHASGKICGKDFGFCYSPEFIAIGSVIHDLLEPDFFLLGAFDDRSAQMLETFYSTVCDTHAPIRKMNIVSAELTKISLNSYVTMKITFANMLAEVAQHIPGVHVDDVTTALGHDKRIGKPYLRAGLGYGGPCFPRDNRAFATMAAKYGVAVPYAEKTDEYNTTIAPRMAEFIMTNTAAQEPVSILGLSYKPGTSLSEESQAIHIARLLVQRGYHVHAWNPAGNEHAQTLLGDSVTFHSDMASCVANGSTVFVSNWDSAFSDLPRMNVSGKTIVDPWRQFSQDAFPTTARYIQYGIGL